MDWIGCGSKLGEGMMCEAAQSSARTLYDCSGYRLPTEAEREYAARAGTTTAFYSGPIVAPVQPAGTPDSRCLFDQNLDRAAWYCSNSGGTTHPGGQKEANDWGLFDTLGNAFEFVSDHYTGSGYGAGPLVDPGGRITMVLLSSLLLPDGGAAESRTWPSRLLRGGGSNTFPTGCKASTRWGLGAQRGPLSGFRLARTAR